MQPLQNNPQKLCFSWSRCAESTSISMPSFSDSILFHDLTNLQEFCLVRRREEAGKHAQRLVRHSLSLHAEGDLGAGQLFCKVIRCPMACTNLLFGLATESALGAFTEDWTLCKIFCPRHMVATKRLWVPVSAWASACLAQFVERVGL